MVSLSTIHKSQSNLIVFLLADRSYMVCEILCMLYSFFSFYQKAFLDMVVSTDTNWLKAWAALFLMPALMQIYDSLEHLILNFLLFDPLPMYMIKFLLMICFKDT